MAKPAGIGHIRAPTRESGRYFTYPLLLVGALNQLTGTDFVVAAVILTLVAGGAVAGRSATAVPADVPVVEVCVVADVAVVVVVCEAVLVTAQLLAFMKRRVVGPTIPVVDIP